MTTPEIYAISLKDFVARSHSAPNGFFTVGSMISKTRVSATLEPPAMSGALGILLRSFGDGQILRLDHVAQILFGLLLDRVGTASLPHRTN